MCVVVVIALINYVASHNIITMQHKHYNKDGGQGEDIPAAHFVAFLHSQGTLRCFFVAISLAAGFQNRQF